MAPGRLERDPALQGNVLREVAGQMGLAQAAETESYLNAIARRVQRGSGVEVTVYIADTADPNAFAGPGGTLVVSRGLLALANSEDELATLLGHEISHLALGHLTRTARRQWLPHLLKLPGQAVQGLVSESLGRALNAPIDLLGDVTLASYSREQEAAADRMGLRLAAAAGYDPAALASLLTRMETVLETETATVRRFRFGDSHPLTPQRVEAVQAEAGQLDWRARPALAGSREEFLDQLEGLVVGPNPAHGVVRGNQFYHPVGCLGLTLPEGWKAQVSPLEMAAVAPTEDAVFLVRPLGPMAETPREIADTFAQVWQEAGGSSPRVREPLAGALQGERVVLQEGREAEAARVELRWVEHREMVFLLAAAGPAARQETLGQALDSLRDLSAEERASFTQVRLRIGVARRGESLEDFCRRTENLWTPPLTALVNHLDPGAPLEEGQLLKIGHREPFTW